MTPAAAGEIFPLSPGPSAAGGARDAQLHAAWRSFRMEMLGAVSEALASGRLPSEIDYAIGEIVHNYFRARSVTLTGAELRERAAELIGEALPAVPLVTFAVERTAASRWTGDEAAPVRPGTHGPAFVAPPSVLVSLPRRGTPSEDGPPAL